jgi:hypothetical protein
MDDLSMRTEVLRSLLLWPAAASLTLTVALWFPTKFSDNPLRRLTHVSSDVVRPIQLLAASTAYVSEQVEITARSEHGTRAMRLPARLARAFGVDSPSPTRAAGASTAAAGMSTEPEDGQRTAANAGLPPDELHGMMLSGEIKVAPRLATGMSAPGKDDSVALRHSVAHRHPPRSKARPGLRHRGAGRLADHGAPAGSEPSVASVELFQPELNSPENVLEIRDPSDSDSDSVLPRSNRVLARRHLSSPALHASSKLGSTGEIPAISREKDSAGDSLDRLLRAVASDRMNADATHAQDRFPIIVDDPSSDADKSKRAADHLRTIDVDSPAGWPVTGKLHEQLDALSAMAVNLHPSDRNQLVSVSKSSQRLSEWTEEVTAQLGELRSLSRLGDVQAGKLIDRLDALAVEGLRRAEEVEDRSKQVQWLSTSHAIARRAAVWKLVWEVNRGENAWMVGGLSEQESLATEDAIAAVRDDLQPTGDAQGWDRYLLLDEIENAGQLEDEASRRRLAQRFLSRLQWHRLSGEQQRWLAGESITNLARLLRPWAQDAVDYAKLLQQIEMQESDPPDLASAEIAAAVQTLRHADNPLARRVAEAIDTYYRNANVRMAVSASLLERLAPEMEPQSVPVNTMILGSRVRGQSAVESDLDLALVPSPDRWSLRLGADGNLVTRSTGVRDSVSVLTLGQSRFRADTTVEVMPNAVSIGDPEVDVHGETRLQGITTRYDGVPLFGALVRSIAEDRFREVAPRANQISNRVMKERIASEMEQKLEDQIDAATDRLTSQLLGPLGRLQLDPMVTDMQTTDERLVARFRVAGDWQMAAFTPRPRAPGNSLASLQVHQSAINNMLERLVPRGESVSIRELMHRVTETFGRDDLVMPEDIPEDVTIQFASTRPITVEIEDNRIWITMRIVRLRRPDSVDLTHFIVRAAYQPRIDGIRASLVRDGHLRISGPRMSMRERLPARTIFNKIFLSNRELVMTAKALQEHPAADGLAISQMELRDGWIAMAVSAQGAPRIALAD